MKCPFCKIELREKKFKNIYGLNEKAYQCFQCGGIFLPELGGLRINKKEAKNLEDINISLFKKEFFIPDKKILKCPNCGKNMKRYRNPKYRKFFILFCNNCKGMFFNRGELIRFAEKKESYRVRIKESEILRKIYEKEGKEALLKMMPYIIQDEKEIKRRVKREIEQETAEFLLKEYASFLIPFSKFPGNVIASILLSLIPFLREMFFDKNG